MNINIRLIYLYLFAFVGLFTVVIGSVRMVDLGLKIFVFKDADKYEYVTPVAIDEKRTLMKRELKSSHKENKHAIVRENSLAPLR